MRRLVIEEPVSRAATAAWRIGLFSLPVLVSGILLIRLQLVTFEAGFAVFAAASILAVASVIFSVAAFVQIWREGRRGLRQTICAFLLGAIVLAYPVFLAARFILMPYFADLSTDTVSPPAFSRSSAAMDARAHYIPGTATGDKDNILSLWTKAFNKVVSKQAQRRQYPDFLPKRTELAPDVVFARAREMAKAEGWHIVDSTPPGGRFGFGHLDALKYTSILKLPVDVTVRLRTHAQGTTIDVRSIPRYPLFDLGTSPRFIEYYLEKVSPAEGVARG